jgi:hypothetical protein
MSTFIGLRIFASILLATLHPGSLPSNLLGNWTVGVPFDAGQPVGLDAKQEDKIKALNIRFAPDHIEVCGKSVLIKSIDVDRLTRDEFLRKYNFLPDVIGLKSNSIVEVSINALHSTDACGDFEDPGSHLFIGDRHVVMEVGNDYFPLKRVGGPDTKDGKMFR